MDKRLITQAELLRATNCGLPRLKRLEYSRIILADESSTGNRRLFDATYIDVIKELSNKKPRMTSKQLEVQSRSDVEKLKSGVNELSSKMLDKVNSLQSKIENLELAQGMDRWNIEELTQKIESQSQIINNILNPEIDIQNALTITIPPTDLAEIEKAIITLKHARDEAKKQQEFKERQDAKKLKEATTTTILPKQPKLTKAQEEQERKNRRALKQRAIQADYKRMCEEYQPIQADLDYINQFIQVQLIENNTKEILWEHFTSMPVLEALDICKDKIVKLGKSELKDPTTYETVLTHTKQLTPPNPESDIFLPQWENETPYVSRFATTELIASNKSSEGTYISSVNLINTNCKEGDIIATSSEISRTADDVTDVISEWGDIVDEEVIAPTQQMMYKLTTTLADPTGETFPKLWQEQLKNGTLINHPNPPDIDFSYLDLEFDDPEYNVGALRAKAYQELWNRFRTIMEKIK